VRTPTGNVVLTTLYSENSAAKGALFSFVFITDSGDVDFSKSFLLALDRNASRNHTLPFNLCPGLYRVHVYDIEENGAFSNGMGYPADEDEIVSIEGGQGNIFSYNHRVRVYSFSRTILVLNLL
jgi:hypothetical protein